MARTETETEAREPKLAEIHKLTPLQDQKAEPEDARLWSVTTIIGIVTGFGLERWKIEQPIKLACEELEVHGDKAPWLSRLHGEGPKSAIEYLTAFRWDSKALASTELGTAVHTACEAYALSGQRPSPSDIATFVERAQAEKRDPGQMLAPDVVEAECKVIGRMLDAFDLWLDVFQPTYLAAEVTVYSPRYGYAGTCDGFLEIDGVPLIFDYKSSREDLTSRGKPKSPYPDSALQLSAYRYAEMAAIWRPRQNSYYRRRYYLLSEAEREMAVPVPKVDGGIVIFITPERCEAYPVKCDEEVFESFLARVDDARFEFETSKDIVGNPLVPVPVRP